MQDFFYSEWLSVGWFVLYTLLALAPVIVLETRRRSHIRRYRANVRVGGNQRIVATSLLRRWTIFIAGLSNGIRDNYWLLVFGYALVVYGIGYHWAYHWPYDVYDVVAGVSADTAAPAAGAQVVPQQTTWAGEALAYALNGGQSYGDTPEGQAAKEYLTGKVASTVEMAKHVFDRPELSWLWGRAYQLSFLLFCITLPFILGDDAKRKAVVVGGMFLEWLRNRRRRREAPSGGGTTPAAPPTTRENEGSIVAKITNHPWFDDFLAEGTFRFADKAWPWLRRVFGR